MSKCCSIDKQENKKKCCGHEHSHDNHDHDHGHSHNHDLKKEKYNIIFSLIFFFGMVIADHMYDISQYSKYIFIGLYVFSGYMVIKEAIEAMLAKDFFNEFTLMSSATIGAIAIGEYPEAVGVMLFYRIGEFLQEYVANKSRDSIKNLVLSKPEHANLVVGDIIEEVPVDDLKVNDVLIVKSGENVPTDSIIINGETSLDTSSITGEFMPVSVKEGDEVMGGFINLGAVITVKVIREFVETSLSRTMELIEDSTKNKAPTEKFITKFARYYTPVVFLIAFLVATVPPLFMNGEWNAWIYKALVMLVISCPCALVISVPLSYFATIGVASKRGILIKGGIAVDAAKDIDMVVFDKTGTLTEGKLSIEKIVLVNASSEEELMNVAKSIEQYSNHPIAKAIMGDEVVSHSEDFDVEEVSGKGLVLKHGEETLFAGNAKLLKDNNISFEEVKETGTVVYVAKNSSYYGAIVLNDTIKTKAKPVIDFLHKLGIKTYMLTGDNSTAAEDVANKLGLDGYKASLLPEGKLSELEEFQKSKNVMFVGDGTNDAPVLAASKLGVAMGGAGSKLAVEVADVIISNDDIGKVSEIVNLSKNTNKIVWQNIVLALGIKTLFMVFGVAGVSGLWEAVFADVGVSLLAIFNSLRLLKYKI